MSETQVRPAARARPLTEADRGGTAARIVCTALALALLVLALRIAAIW
jgi:uncharacterized iron-regulated membrane protein